MDINRNNYEAFLLDLLEGRLSSEEERELNTFLKDHPEFSAEMPDVNLFSLEKNALAYPHRDQLKKEFPVAGTPVSEANFDMYSIARMEGDLDPLQEQEHEAMLERDEEKSMEWQYWQLTRLVPETLSYPAKQSLKKRNPVRIRRIWISGLSAAATLTLVFLLLRMDSISPGIADTEPAELLPAQEEAVVARELSSENLEAAPLAVEEDPVEDPRTELIAAISSPEPLPNEVHEIPPSEEIELEAAAETDAQLISEKIKSRPLRIAGTLSGTAAMGEPATSDRIEPLPITQVSARSSKLPMNEIAEIDRQILFEEFTRENNISLLSVANAGINGINRLTGSDISLMASRDEEGDVSGFRLKSKRFSFSKPLAREE